MSLQVALGALRTPTQVTPSVFPMEVAVVGDLESDGPVRIEGTLEGNVRGTAVTVSHQAAVIGTIRADTVRVDGAVDGSIEADTVFVFSHARITGTVTCDTLILEEGARIDAGCRAGCEEAAAEAGEAAVAK